MNQQGSDTHRLTRRGQALIEYSMCVAIVIAALIAMQVYVKRGISGKLRAAADSTGEQYDPRKTTGQSTIQTVTDTSDRTLTVTEQLLGQKLEQCFDLNGNGVFGDDCDFCVGSTIQSCDLNGDGTCTGPTSDRLFATITVRCLDRNETNRASIETVAPLGTNIWN